MALFINTEYSEELEEDDSSLAISPAMKEDLELEEEDHGPFSVSPVMKEDLERDNNGN